MRGPRKPPPTFPRTGSSSRVFVDGPGAWSGPREADNDTSSSCYFKRWMLGKQGRKEGVKGGRREARSGPGARNQGNTPSVNKLQRPDLWVLVEIMDRGGRGGG
eukprot:6912872-Pyramimonas_sp.AAC.1